MMIKKTEKKSREGVFFLIASPLCLPGEQNLCRLDQTSMFHVVTLNESQSNQYHVLYHYTQSPGSGQL